MKKMLALVLALVMVISMMPLTFVSAQTTDRVADRVANMSLRDKVTQMLMVDFRKWGATAESAVDFTVMNDEVRQIVEDYNFGSVIYFANNIKTTEETYALTIEMQEAATKDGGIALIICADQEGGSVYRLGSGTALPGNMALGATYAVNGTKYAYEAGKIIGSELSVLGINGNLAPVVDVNNNANNPVIGLRSYGDDAVMVGELASASIAGMAEYNVIGTAKHFPGHGDTATDSHYGLPSVDKPLDVLMENELAPYVVAIDQGIEMIMTAHILYPQLESDKIYSNKTKKEESLPATMSDDILTGLLKGEMGFDGIVVTDAMNMAGIAGSWDQVQSCVIAIQSGVDMICMPCQLYCKADLANLDKIIDGLIAAVEDGTIPMERVNDAVTRILTVKENRGILDYNAEDYSLEKAKATVGSDENREMERELAAAAVTVIKNDGTLPLKVTENTKVLMLVPYSNETSQMLMGWNRAKEAGLIPAGAEVDYYRFNSTTINSTLQAKLDWADVYIINSEINGTGRMEYKHWLSAAPQNYCEYAAANGKIAIISSVDKPYDVQMYPNANAIVAAYGCKGSSVDVTEALVGGATGSEAAYGPNIIAAVEVILGVFDAQGKLPVNIPVYDVTANAYTDVNAFRRGYGLCTSHIFEDGVCVVCCTVENPVSQITGITGQASSVDTSEPAHNKDVANAFDGDTNTFWATVPGGTLAEAYLIADLGGEHTINQVNYTKRYDSGAKYGCTGNLLDYIIEVSVDGETWTEVAKGDTVDGTTEITFDAVNARYVKLTATKSYHWQEVNANTVMTAAEFEVFELVEKAHNPGEAEMENVVPSTCTEDGSYDSVVYCSVCCEELSREACIIEDLGGHVEETISSKDPTCTETGLTEGKKCSICDEILVAQEEIPALGHNEEVIPGADATCTETGLTEGKKCDLCGEILVAQEEIPALGHNDGPVVVENEKPSTCTEGGYYDAVCYCTVCGVETYRSHIEVGPDGHYPVVYPGYPATCTEPGLTDGTRCGVCLEWIEPQEEIPALGHNYVDGSCVNCGEADPNAATVIASGWSGYTTWTLTDDGILTFSPTEQKLENGETNMKNYWKVGGVLTLPWGEYADLITEVVIEDGIHDLGQMAFYELPNLTTVTLGADIVEIRNYAFKNCANLTTINLENVDFIREGAFYGCSTLENLSFMDGVEVEDWAFSKTPYASMNP